MDRNSEVIFKAILKESDSIRIVLATVAPFGMKDSTILTYIASQGLCKLATSSRFLTN